MADTRDVVSRLELGNNETKLLAIVANVRGAEEAVVYDEISILGFPFSISPTFQMRNTNSSMGESLRRVEDIQALCVKQKKDLVIYLSMGFGNPYRDVYNEEILLYWADEMIKRGITIISLSDTVGVAAPQQITLALNTLIPKYPRIEFGVHLHSTIENWQAKTAAAFEAGCNRFDGALMGIGGCPMANDDLVGNMNTEWMINYFKSQDVLPQLNFDALQNSLTIAGEIFDKKL
jgi:hydroxymethylglutaryl-CoA lyase